MFSRVGLNLGYHFGAKCSLKRFWGIQESSWMAWGTSRELVRFSTPFSENMFQTHQILHGFGAAWHSEPDEADESDVSDEGKMVHGRQFGP